MEGISRTWLDRFLRAALDEDLGAQGDVTSDLLFPPERMGVGRFEAREDGVLAGSTLLPDLAALVDPALTVELIFAEGTRMKAMDAFARSRGPIRSLLTMERLALNLVGRLSGVATLTRRFVDAAGPKLKIADTRKTTPLLRPLEKYAVRIGGGVNHRFGLFDSAMIKDNHRLGTEGDLARAVKQVRAKLSHATRLVVEVTTPAEADVAASSGADVLLLDNMEPPMIRGIVAKWGGKLILEASGGITMDNVAGYAATGVDLISTGALTRSSRWLDVAYEFEQVAKPGKPAKLAPKKGGPRR